MLNHLLPSVMNRHLNFGAQCVLKVSLAVQILNRYQHSGYSR